MCMSIFGWFKSKPTETGYPSDMAPIKPVRNERPTTGAAAMRPDTTEYVGQKNISNYGPAAMKPFRPQTHDVERMEFIHAAAIASIRNGSMPKTFHVESVSDLYDRIKNHCKLEK